MPNKIVAFSFSNLSETIKMTLRSLIEQQPFIVKYKITKFGQKP